MVIDTEHVILAVTREVSTRQHGGSSAHVLVASRTFGPARKELWNALTDPQRISRWFLPITGELRPGGTYQLEGNAGGEILACEPPNRIELTWRMGGQASWVTLILSDGINGATSLRLEHMAHVPDDFWRQFGPGAVGVGWDHALLLLARHCDGITPAPESGAAWFTTEQGKDFARRSSQAWSAASIAAGADQAGAQAASARTTAFYTGVEPVSETSDV
jgi:uncharacterized protein YndB with AHSA1/START domain